MGLVGESSLVGGGNWLGDGVPWFGSLSSCGLALTSLFLRLDAVV